MSIIVTQKKLGFKKENVALLSNLPIIIIFLVFDVSKEINGIKIFCFF